MKIEKRKFSGTKDSKDSKEDACFEYSKKGHSKRDCYRLKNKPKQPVVSKDDKKSRALMSWSDDEDYTSDAETSNESVNLVLVGHNDVDMVRGLTNDVIFEEGSSESDDNNSEINSFNFDLSNNNVILDGLTMYDYSPINVQEYEKLKAENNKLEEKNSYLRKMILDLVGDNAPIVNQDVIVATEG